MSMSSLLDRDKYSRSQYIRPNMHPKKIVARRGPPSVDYEVNQNYIGMLGPLPSPFYYFDFHPGLKLQCKNKLADFL